MKVSLAFCLTYLLANIATIQIQCVKLIPLSRSCEESFQNECLRLHNNYRAIHSSPLLSLSKNLTQLATNYSNYLATTNTFRTSNVSFVGQNIGIFYSSDSLKQTNCTSNNEN